MKRAVKGTNTGEKSRKQISSKVHLGYTRRFFKPTPFLKPLESLVGDDGIEPPTLSV